jgi:non-specific serine/threonine protein kinase/serine/threonine-protein kinase
LKPANILVTAAGSPMLLDFGIAKLLDPAAVGVTRRASGETRASFTPQYASPEQMLGLPLTTATDTYALGVILYELLTGERPHQMTGSPADWIRSICVDDTEPPSTAVRRSKTGGQAHAEANAGEVERRLRGDLDAIVLKALRKEPKDRYKSVDELAEDIRRHLDGRPVLARKNTAPYVMKKFLSRHKWGAAGAAAMVALLTGGVASTLYQARIAARRFEDVRKLAHTFLFEVHDSIQDLPGSTPARSLIAGTGTEYLNRLARDARGDRALQLEVAEGYLKIGDVQGNPFGPNLGDTAKAIESYRKALAVAQASGSRDVRSRQVLARIHENLASVLPFDGKAAEGLQHAQQAVALYGEIAQTRRADVEAKLDLARGFEAQGDVEGGSRGINLGRAADAAQSYEQSLALIPQLASSHPSAARAARARAVILLKLGDIQARTGNASAALQKYQSALDTADKLAGADPHNARSRNLVTAVLNRLAATQMSVGDNQAAEATFERALALDEAALAADPNNEKARTALVVTEKNLGDLFYYNLNNFHEALRAYRRVAELLEAQVSADPQNIVWKQNLSEVLTYVASALLESQEPAEARRQAQRGLALAKEVADRPGATHDQIYNFAWLGITIEPADLRDAKAVLPYAKRAVELSGGTDPLSLHVLAQARAAMGDFAHAVESEEQALKLFSIPEAGKPAPASRATVERSLAEFRRAAQRRAAASLR